MDCEKARQRQMQNNLLIDSWSKSNFSFLYPERYVFQATMPLSKSFYAQGKYVQMDEEWWNNWIWWGLEQDWDGTLSELYKFPYQKAGSTQYTCNGWEIFIPLSVYIWHQMKKLLLIAYGMKVHSCDCKTTDKTTATDQLVQHLICGLVTQESLMNACTT